MKEIDIDISSHHSKSIEEFRGTKFDFVVTVCDSAKQGCPFFPGKNYIHKGFQDPSRFDGTKNEIIKTFRTVRDEIKDWIKQYFSNEVI